MMMKFLEYTVRRVDYSLISVRILNYCKPKWFIFENVRDLLYRNEGKDWETVK